MPSDAQASASSQHADSVHVAHVPFGSLYPHFGVLMQSNVPLHSVAHACVHWQFAAALKGPSAFGNFVRHEAFVPPLDRHS